MTIPANPDRFTIAILALGGQGGGVLADWIIQLAANNGFIAQGTSVPGVAQRTGSTIYYIEMVRQSAPDSNRPPPVLALMPVPGDVDIVIASELMEAGRALVRGLVTNDRTTLVSSTHRIYAISEKSAPGDGRASSERILEAAGRRAKRFVGFDMENASEQSGSVISAIMFGALSGSDALPFPASAFEQAIREGGIAVPSNLKGFKTGADGAKAIARAETAAAPALPQPTTANGKALLQRISKELPEAVHQFAIEGVRKLLEYQDRRYADFYLDRVAAVRALDDGQDGWLLTRETARYLALWMSYEDTIRVADLKVRATRKTRVSRDVNVGDKQLMTITDYMHPRFQEVAETMPAWLGSALLGSSLAKKLLGPMFKKGRHVKTTSLRWYFALRTLASLRVIRRSTLRYRDEQARIEAWLMAIREIARTDLKLATEVALAARLIKGYSDTFERGLERFNEIMTAARSKAGGSDIVSEVRKLREAALAS